MMMATERNTQMAILQDLPNESRFDVTIKQMKCFIDYHNDNDMDRENDEIYTYINYTEK